MFKFDSERGRHVSARCRLFVVRWAGLSRLSEERDKPIEGSELTEEDVTEIAASNDESVREQVVEQTKSRGETPRYYLIEYYRFWGIEWVRFPNSGSARK